MPSCPGPRRPTQVSFIRSMWRHRRITRLIAQPITTVYRVVWLLKVAWPYVKDWVDLWIHYAAGRRVWGVRC